MSQFLITLEFLEINDIQFPIQYYKKLKQDRIFIIA